MSTPIPEGLGKCGLCHRSIRQTDSIDSIMLGRPPRAYICHQSCKKAKVAKEGPIPQVTQADYMKLAPETRAQLDAEAEAFPSPQEWVSPGELDKVREDMMEALRTDGHALLNRDLESLASNADSLKETGVPVGDELVLRNLDETPSPISPEMLEAAQEDLEVLKAEGTEPPPPNAKVSVTTPDGVTHIGFPMQSGTTSGDDTPPTPEPPAPAAKKAAAKKAPAKKATKAAPKKETPDAS